MTSSQLRASPLAPFLSFGDCKLTPTGVSAIMAHLRTLPFLQTIPEARVRAAAIALIAFGGSSDGMDPVPRGESTLRSGSYDAHATSMRRKWQNELGEEYMRILTDMLASYDRASGGVSLLISTPATSGSSTSPTITDVKMNVFLPIAPFGEQPRTRIAFAQMVQSFAEEIALPAMQRLAEAKKTFTFPRSLTVAADVDSRLDTQPLIPSSDTPWHTFYGRGIGVLEQLIAEEFAVVGAVSATSSTIPRPILSRVPAAFVPHAQSFPSSDVGKGKQSEHNPWTIDDVRFFAQQFEVCRGNDDAGCRAILQRVSTRLPELFGAVVDLVRRVDELELSKQTYLFEMESLRQVLQDPSPDGSRVQPTRIMTETRVPSVPEPTQRSPRRFHEEDSSKSRLGRSGMSKTGGPMTSFVSSVPISPSHPSTYDTLGSQSRTSLGGGKIFGPSTEVVQMKHKLPRRTHTILRDVEKNYPEDYWVQTLSLKLPEYTDDVVHELVEAMRSDRRLGTPTPS